VLLGRGQIRCWPAIRLGVGEGQCTHGDRVIRRGNPLVTRITEREDKKCALLHLTPMAPRG
jgi:hypothetical protein